MRNRGTCWELDRHGHKGAAKFARSLVLSEIQGAAINIRASGGHGSRGESVKKTYNMAKPKPKPEEDKMEKRPVRQGIWVVHDRRARGMGSGTTGNCPEAALGCLGVQTSEPQRAATWTWRKEKSEYNGTLAKILERTKTDVQTSGTGAATLKKKGSITRGDRTSRRRQVRYCR